MIQIKDKTLALCNGAWRLSSTSHTPAFRGDVAWTIAKIEAYRLSRTDRKKVSMLYCNGMVAPSRNGI